MSRRAARGNADGSPDSTFDSDGIAIKSDGSLDGSFGASGIARCALDSCNDIAHSTALQSDDRIVVAGSSTVGSDYDPAA
jgi:hypothetical protein